MGIKKPNHGFTLVEMMIVIVIIGILMAIAIPAVTRTITTGKQTAIRMEISALEQAVEQYMQKFGDYPPDGSSRDVVIRHMRRRFPRISEPDTSLLNQLTGVRGAPATASTVAMDRAEALVFFLGGFSDNALHPLTGEGGPLEFIGTPMDDAADINFYQYNATRDNSLFDFDPARLTYGRATDASPLRSTDESVWSGAQLNEAGGVDVLPVYLAGGAEPAPIVYFDSRTYGLVAPGVYNGFLHPSLGGVRPYKTGRDIKPPGGSNYGTAAAAFAAVPFHNPKSFQIISPGLDGRFGSLVSVGAEPVHYITETGVPVFPNASATNTAGLAAVAAGYGPRYQEGGTEVSGHLDNITNFSSSTLEDDLQ